MDPLSHAVAGRAVTALLENGENTRLGPGAGAAAIVGALSPDVDIVLAPAGWDIYLRAHEVGTHSVIGALVVAGCVAALTHRMTPGARYLPLAAAASAGVLSHLALDALSGARLRPAWPFVPTYGSLPLVAMADPWLLAMFVAGAFMMWARRHRLRSAAQLLVGVVFGFLCLKGALLDRALRSVNVEPSAPRMIEARWGSLTQWHVLDRTPEALRVRLVNARGEPATTVLWLPLEAESAHVRASRSLDTVRNFLHVHELGFATEQSDDANRTTVLWSDIRYCWRPVSSGPPIACGLWFGGIFGPDGRIVAQEVKVGSWLQSRPAPR